MKAVTEEYLQASDKRIKIELIGSINILLSRSDATKGGAKEASASLSQIT